MKPVRAYLRRILMAAVILVLAAGAIAPLLNANRFRGQIHSALETALSRRVTIGKVRFNVFTGPGFTVKDVLIEEAPGMGIEPFAHVESLQARIRLASLWTGHLSFSTLKLVEPSVNFVKSGDGPWNIQPWLNRAAANASIPRGEAPEIQIRDGRLNFKFGNTKSVFYVSNADLDAYPNANGDLVVRFTGEPARTDHAAQGLGRLVARGVVRSISAGEDQLSLSVQLERTAIQELARLFNLEDAGVRGFVASNLKLDGPLSHIAASGNLRIEDIHRWDLMPNKGEGWTLDYTGFVNVPGQQVEIETRPGDAQGTPVNGKFQASNYLTAPRWKASLSLHDLPVAGLLDTARHMGAPFPVGAALNASLNGEIAYAPPDGIRGDLVLNHASFQFPQGGATEFDGAPLAIANNQIHFGPVDIRAADHRTASVEVRYALNRRALTLNLGTDQMGIAHTRDLIARLLGASAIPFLEQCRDGTWKGSLAFEQQEENRAGTWTGAFDLTAAELDVAGLASPVRIASAAVQMLPDQIVLTRLRARASPLAFEGEYRHFMEGKRPDRFRFWFPEMQLVEVEKQLRPTLARDAGLFAMALRLGRSRVPDWLKERNLDGVIQTKSLRAGDGSFGAARARVVWNGTSIHVSGIESMLDEMAGAGKLDVDLSAASPQYRLAGTLRGIDYRDGKLDLEGALETAGVGLALAANAKAEGVFSGLGFDLGPDAQMDEISGDYRLEMASAGPRLSLGKVQLTQGGNSYHGQGSIQADGHLVLDVVGAGKPVRFTGMLLPLHPPPAP